MSPRRERWKIKCIYTVTDKGRTCLGELQSAVSPQLLVLKSSAKGIRLLWEPPAVFRKSGVGGPAGTPKRLPRLGGSTGEKEAHAGSA